MRSNSTNQAATSKPLLKLGFCTNADAEEALVASGLDPLNVWRRGRDVENFDWLLLAYREREGVLMVAEDLRLFGETKDEIFAKTSRLHKAGVTLHDIRFPDRTPFDIIRETERSISSKAGMKDRRTAKKRGRKGGEAKGIAAQQKREALDRDGVLTRLFNRKDIPWRVRMEIAGPTVKASSARRHFCSAR